MSVERQYRMTRVDGHYVFTHNDGKRTVVVTSYEDGPSYRRDDMKRDRKMWVWGTIPASEMEERVTWLAAIEESANPFDRSTRVEEAQDKLLHWLANIPEEGGYYTRKDAVTAALENS